MCCIECCRPLSNAAYSASLPLAISSYSHCYYCYCGYVAQQVVQLLTAHAATELEPLVRDLMAQHSTCQLSLQHMLEVSNSNQHTQISEEYQLRRTNESYCIDIFTQCSYSAHQRNRLVPASTQCSQCCMIRKHRHTHSCHACHWICCALALKPPLCADCLHVTHILAA
jgi:hypothetical protein